ncbi:hypothetical protein YK56LOC_62510 [Caballeronia sp. HLA56]
MPAEEHFDSLVQLAAAALKMPSAFINFVDDATTWCKAAWGAVRENRPNEDCLCSMALTAGELLIVPDALSDPAYSAHPIVNDAGGVRFYAGVVLRIPGGHPLGTFCVTDTQPRQFQSGEIRTLRQFAQQVVKHLEGVQAQREIRTLEERLELARINRDRFLAMLSHELRAPLAPITTAVQVLQQDHINVEQRKWAKSIIGRNVRYMSEIVDHMLSASLVSFGAVELELEPVSAKALVDRAVELSHGFIIDAQHLFTCTVIDDPWVHADQTQCPLLISNLLTNAAKYTPEGGRIELTVRAGTEGVEIHVCDTGIGIDPDEMDEIFEVFGQGKQPLDRAKGGLGLGLALARRIAEWHGGTLKAESHGRGHGSDFILTLRHADKPLEHTVPEAASAFSELDIVIVDDNADTAEALGLYYQMSGHVVRIAYRAEDALELMLARQPDVLISDIGLPDTDGYQLIEKIASFPAMSHTVFIAVTGYGSDLDKKKALQAGFDAHFVKPVVISELDLKILELVKWKRLR